MVGRTPWTDVREAILPTRTKGRIYVHRTVTPVKAGAESLASIANPKCGRSPQRIRPSGRAGPCFAVRRAFGSSWPGRGDPHLVRVILLADE